MIFNKSLKDVKSALSAGGVAFEIQRLCIDRGPAILRELKSAVKKSELAIVCPRLEERKR